MHRTGTGGGHTRLLGVIGHPVNHSISPQMHNAAFAAQGMGCHYTTFAVAPADLETALRGIRSLGILGVNVTIPHKETVMTYLDEVSPLARHVGAVNTIINRQGRLIGYNTDGWGFLSSLEEVGVRPDSRHAVVLGAGGAAKAIAYHLALGGAATVTIVNRTVERAEALAHDVREAVDKSTVAALTTGSTGEAVALSRADLVVNCTPLGMSSHEPDATPLPNIHLLAPHAVVYDTVYRPASTRLLREASSRGLRVVTGLGMLVHQGACSWEYWFGRRGPVAVMRQAAESALAGDE